MSVTGIAMVTLVCWAAILIGIVVLVARKFFAADRSEDETDAHGPPRP